MRLKYKLVIGSVLLMGSGVLGISISSYRLIKQTCQGELESKGTLLLRSFADQYADAIQRKDKKKLAKGLEDLTSDPEVVYGMSRDMRGNLIARAGVTHERPEDILLVSMAAKAKAKPQTGESFFIPSVESSGAVAEDVGIVSIGLSTKPTAIFIKNVRRGMATFIGGALALTLLFSSVFAWKLSKPLGAMLLALEEIGKGNLHYVVNIHSRDEFGQVARAFNVMTSDLRKAREQLVDAHAQLEGRLNDLADNNRQLQSAQEKVVRAEKLAAIGKLASGVGHELRNPLGGIRNALYYIRDCLTGTPLAQQDPSLLEFISLAEKEIKSSNDIIGDLLEFSRIVKLSTLPTDVNAVLSTALGSLDVPATVKIIEDYHKDLPRAMIDAQKIRQVFTNLALNAIHAMPKGGELHVASRLEGPRDNPQSRINIRFRDTGTGIAPEICDRIFEPLFSTKAKGTGLGLSICQGFVQAHGGRITVISGLGKGTTFTIVLPLGTAATT